ncbi:MAG: EpsG family protein [Pseudomonadota bacterium]
MTYIGIYLALALTSFVVRRRDEQRVVLLLACLLLFLFVGTREYVGCDFTGYLNRFESYSIYPPEVSLQTPEFGFLYLNRLVVDAGGTLMWVNIACAAIFFTCFYLFARNKTNPLGLLALFFPIIIVQLSMSGIRQATALAILLLAWDAFIARNRVGYLLALGAAASFHTSAVIFLPLVALIGRPVKLATLIPAALATLPIAYVFLGERSDVYVQRYVEGDVESFGAVFRLGLLVITAIFFEVYIRRFAVVERKMFQLLRFGSLLIFALIPAFFVSTLIVHRLGYYAATLQLYMLSSARRVNPNRSDDALFAYLPFAAYLLYMLVWFATSRHAELCYMPYDSYIF